MKIPHTRVTDPTTIHITHGPDPIRAKAIY